MKRSFKKMQGVTLLEIMLVLAIAAMVIVMSIRYYQSATASQQTNMVLNEIQGIVSAVDGVTQGSGSYQTVSNAQITNVLPATGLTTPWGTNITVAGVSPTSYTITLPGVPSQVCPLLIGKMANNTHFTGMPAVCPAAAAPMTITYNSAV